MAAGDESIEGGAEDRGVPEDPAAERPPGSGAEDHSVERRSADGRRETGERRRRRQPVPEPATDRSGSGPVAPPRREGAPSSGEEAVSVDPAHPGFRSGYLALVGAPNVGKSTLMNRLLQERLAIVTSKPQTTRRKTLGILNGEDYQLVILDTPGLMEARYDLHRAMLREAYQALEDADLILLLADARAPVAVPEAVRHAVRPRYLALNKVDLVPRREELLPVLSAWHETGLFEELFPISALDGTGVGELAKVTAGRLPFGPPFYPPDQLAEQPERFFAAEIIRERIFERFEEEVPYATEVVVEEFTERPEARDFIRAVIVVEQESQKGILIGRGGRAIRALGEEARLHLEAFLQRPVYLELRVRVMEKWRRRAAALRRLGYRG